MLQQPFSAPTAAVRALALAAGALLFSACGGEGAQLGISPKLIPNPSGRVPLAAVVEFQSADEVQAQLKVTDGTNSWSKAFGPQAAKDETYSLPVLGMRPDREHSITLTLTAADGRQSSHSFQHRTPPLPGNPLAFPPLQVKVAQPERMEPGLTFLSVRRRALGRPHWLTEKQAEFSRQWGMLMAIDADGEVVWH